MFRPVIMRKNCRFFVGVAIAVMHSFAHAEHQLIDTSSMAMLPFFESLRVQGCKASNIDDVMTTKGRVQVTLYGGCQHKIGLVTIKGMNRVGVLYDRPNDKQASIRQLMQFVGATVVAPPSAPLVPQATKPQGESRVFEVVNNSPDDYGEESIQIEVKGGVLSIYAVGFPEVGTKALLSLRKGECVRIVSPDGFAQEDGYISVDTVSVLEKVRCR